MAEYTVTLRLSDQAQFIHFIDTVGPAMDRLVVTVKSTEQEDAIPDTPIRPAKPAVARATRGPRGSKVNTAILQALMGGSRTVKELKAALEAGNLSPGSLSTGLAVLQRSKQVQRIEDGLYGLAA
jgi:hypothetical protein